MVEDGEREKMNKEDFDDRYVTYKSMNISAIIVMTIWFLNSCAVDRLNDKISELDKRLTRTEAICYGTGNPQSN